MSAEWFYLKNRQNLGPFSQDQLRQLAQQGQLLPTDLVWKNGMANWSPANSIPGLLPGRQQTPVAPTPPAAAPSAAPNLDRDYQQILSQGWREMVRDTWQAWQGLNPTIKIIAISAVVLLFVLIGIWILLPRSGGHNVAAARDDSDKGPALSKVSPPPVPRDVPRETTSGSGTARDINAELAPKLIGKWQITQGNARGGSVEFTRTGTVILAFRGDKGTETVSGSYAFKNAGSILLEKAGSTTRNEGWLIELEFIGDDELNLVNAGDPLGGFGFLTGRLRRIK